MEKEREHLIRDTMNPKHIKISKFLSYVLRHKPDAIGLKLDANGWASVEQLLKCANVSGQNLTPELLETVVRVNDKKRFAFSDDGLKIRASQGHSINIDLELKPLKPPLYLYHGTATRFKDAILSSGLKPGTRQHVHLSTDAQTAILVGQRHGRPIVLIVKAGKMWEDGYSFFRSANDVWLADHVPAQYLNLQQKTDDKELI